MILKLRLTLNKIKALSGILLFCFASTYAAKIKKIDIEASQAPLADIIKSIAKTMGISVVLSDKLQQTTSFYMHQVPPVKAMQALLVANGLARWQIDGLWYIASQADLVKQKETYQKLQTQELRSWRLNYAEAKDVARLIKDDKSSLLSRQGKVRQDERSNTIYVKDVKDSLEKIDRLIKAADVPIKQIRIEVKLANVDSDYERRLGLDIKDNIFPEQGLIKKGLLAGNLLDVRLAALEREGRAELISSPSLFASNQQAASIETGEELPYQEVSQSGGTAVRFKKAVMSLKVLPQILPKDRILLKIRINQDRPSERLVLGVPSIRTRQMTTSVVIKNGETVVLGGIYETNQERGEKRLPILGSLPVIGALFTLQRQQSSKRELLVFVKPVIL